MFGKNKLNKKNARVEGGRRRVQSTLAALAFGAMITLVAALPAHFLHASSNPSVGIPDGGRAAGVYAVDGGYGLRESIYQELLAQLLRG